MLSAIVQWRGTMGVLLLTMTAFFRSCNVCIDVELQQYSADNGKIKSPYTVVHLEWR